MGDTFRIGAKKKGRKKPYTASVSFSDIIFKIKSNLYPDF